MDTYFARSFLFSSIKLAASEFSKSFAVPSGTGYTKATQALAHYSVSQDNCCQTHIKR